MVVIENLVDIKIDTKRLEAIAKRLTSRDIELILCDDSYIQSLNQTHRGKDTPTDVLSFPLDSQYEHMPLGSIVISIDRAKEAASQFGHLVREEILILFVHGLLHLLGYDHEKDSGQMAKVEIEIAKEFNLPYSTLIQRNI